MSKQNVVNWVDSNKDALTELARKIWENPEEPLKETYACNLQKDYLKGLGFRITDSKALPDLAFTAEFGEGKPILGVLGEYDALKIGHGCGHNLLGVGCLGGAAAIKDLIEKGEIKGTIRYYGCPAEETLYGKVEMAREGVFNDLDACLTWHPSSVTMPWAGSLLSLYSAIFSFKGKSAHAGAAPHLGRSALDAVEIMNVGANYMREHIEEQNRVHYIITNGGIEPNTVPADASVWYNVRAPKKAIAQETFRWLTEIAKGAAMITQTSLDEVKMISGCYEVLPNQTLVKLLGKNMEALGGPEFTSEDREFAREISEGFDQSQKEKGLLSNYIPLSFMDKYLHEGVEPSHDFGRSLKASTDVGDVSWITPLAMFGVATWPLGVVAHTWQAVDASGSSLGFHAMHYASKVLSSTLVDLYNDAGLLSQVKAEFAQATDGKKYVSAFDESIV